MNQVVLERHQVEKEAVQTVLDLEQVINNEDFERAIDYVAEAMHYSGPMGTREGGQAYLGQIAQLRLKFHTKKIFVDGDEVCSFYTISAGLLELEACGWFHVKDKKVVWIKTLFDPRPVLAAGIGNTAQS